MSATSSDLAASALVEAAAASSVDRRIVLRDHLGLDLAGVHASLLAFADESADLRAAFAVVLGREASALEDGVYSVRVIRRGRVTVVPYLVSSVAGQNAGSQGFAAALRSAYQGGRRDDGDVRVLITLDAAPVETVLTASEDAAALPELRWPRLAARARALALTGPASGLVDAVVTDIADRRRGSAQQLDLLLLFVTADWKSEPAAGSALHTLGLYLADPDVAQARLARLDRGASWRAKLAGWAAPGEDLDGRLARQPTISDAVAAKISSSLGPAGVDFSRFTLSEVEGTAQAGGLRIARPLVIGGAPAVATVVRGEDVLAVWMPGGRGSVSVRLAGATEGSETVAVVWGGTGATASIADTGTEVEIALEGEGWSAWVIEFRSTVARTRIGMLAYFGDGSWFPVERNLNIDISSGAFIVAASEPEVLAVGAAGQFLGPADVDVPGDGGFVLAAATVYGETAPIPLVLVGEPGSGGDEGDPAADAGGGVDSHGDGDDGRDDDDGEGERGGGGGTAGGLGGASGSGSLPASRTPQQSPVHARIDAARHGATTDPGRVTFTAGTPILVGGTAYELSSQTFAGLRPTALDLEALVLGMPEATAYILTGDGTFEALDDLGLRTTGLLSAEIRAFLEARASFFSVAATRGSVLALGADLGSSEAMSYCAAYSQLLAGIPRGERYRPEWDAVLLADTITHAPTGEVLVAPTNPLTVAFYLSFAAAAEAWVSDARVPSPRDVESIAPTDLLPMFGHHGRWFDGTGDAPFPWRRYRPMYQPGSVTDHDPRLISRRLEFFLDVYPAYRDPRQRLAIAFHVPGDGGTILRALRLFYRHDISRARQMRRGAAVTRPALEVTLYTDGEIPRAVRSLLEGTSDDLADRMLRERVTFRVVDGDGGEDAFSHVTFLFRSRGERTPWPVEMTERAPTTYVGGLATAPGRSTLSGGGESAFAWGTFAPAACGNAGSGPAGVHLEEITRSLLELVGGQPRELVQDGLTRMPTTVVRSQEGAPLYDSSVWVVHLDRLLGLEAFTPTGAHPLFIVDYSESDDPGDPGLDAITVTGKVAPYHHALSVALGDLGSLTEAGRDGILQVLNGVSGKWALQLLRQAPHQVRERIGTVAAIAVLRDLDRCFEPAEGAGVVIPLEELWDAVESRAAATGQHPSCDDLLHLHLSRGPRERLRVTARLVEVKFRTSGQPAAGEARAELETARVRLASLFDVAGAPRLFRGRDLSEVIRAGWTRASAFRLRGHGDDAWVEAALADIAAGDYDLSTEYSVGGDRMGGDVISVEAESAAEPLRLALPGHGTDLGLVRIGRPALDAIARGEPLARPRRWDALRFTSDEPPSDEPPAGGGGAGAPTPAPPGGSGAPPEPAEPLPPAGPGNAAVPTPAGPRTGEGDPEAERLARELARATAKYGLDLEPFQPHLAQVGPSVIRFRTRPLGRQSLAGVQRLALDLGREIGAGEGVFVDQEAYFITVDVPRSEPETVLFRDFEAVLEPPSASGSLDFLVGMAPSGEVRTADLARLPHLLVAGATGSGKSVFLRGLVSSLVRTRSADQLRLMIVDPKQVDFMQFENLPHLMLGGVLTDPGEALVALTETIDRERKRRLPILKDAGVTSVLEYYESGHSVEELAQIVVVVDEFADLATSLDRQERAQFLGLIQRYGQVTRAFGIYLVLATQRPSVNVITGDIKANLTARVALKVQASQDSVTILGRGGAERLRDRGDLIFDHGGNSERLQGFLATTDDARRAIARWLPPAGR